MAYPHFFDTLPSIALKDPLAKLLGVFENGEYTLSYTDIIKASGHSCPTVAGAYLMAYVGLKKLYPNTSALRGEIDVSFKEALHVGVTGVTSQILSHITGATDVSGFKGLGNSFARHGLMHFDVPMQGFLQLKRLDTNSMVELNYDASSIIPHPNMQPLMQKVLSGVATKEEQKEFGVLWQERVQRILVDASKVIHVKML